MRGKFDEPPEYYRQMGAWLAYMATRAGQPIRFVNCSYCDSRHERQSDDKGCYHTVDGDRFVCTHPTYTGSVT